MSGWSSRLPVESCQARPTRVVPGIHWTVGAVANWGDEEIEKMGPQVFPLSAETRAWMSWALTPSSQAAKRYEPVVRAIVGAWEFELGEAERFIAVQPAVSREANVMSTSC